MYFDNIDDPWIDMSLNMLCVYSGDKIYLVLRDSIGELESMRQLDKESVFLDFMNYSFAALYRKIENFVKLYIKHIAEHPQKSDQENNDLKNALEIVVNEIEKIPFLFGIYSALFTVKDVLIVSAQMVGDYISCLADQPIEDSEYIKNYEYYIKSITKYILNFYNVELPEQGNSLIRYLLSKYDETLEDDEIPFIDSVTREKILKMPILGGIDDCIEFGLDELRFNTKFASWPANPEGLYHGFELCFSIFGSWKNKIFQEQRRISPDEQSRLLNDTIEEWIGRKGCWRYNGKGMSIYREELQRVNICEDKGEVYEIHDFGSLLMLILFKTVSELDIGCCRNCAHFFKRKNNKEIFCNVTCRKNDLGNKLLKKFQRKNDKKFDAWITKIEEIRTHLLHYEISIDEYLRQMGRIAKEYNPNLEDLRNMSPECYALIHMSNTHESKIHVPVFRCYDLKDSEGKKDFNIDLTAYAKIQFI